MLNKKVSFSETPIEFPLDKEDALICEPDKAPFNKDRKPEKGILKTKNLFLDKPVADSVTPTSKLSPKSSPATQFAPVKSPRKEAFTNTNEVAEEIHSTIKHQLLLKLDHKLESLQLTNEQIRTSLRNLISYVISETHFLANQGESQIQFITRQVKQTLENPTFISALKTLPEKKQAALRDFIGSITTIQCKEPSLDGNNYTLEKYSAEIELIKRPITRGFLCIPGKFSYTASIQAELKDVSV
jgi:hypothetical protein